MGERRVGHPRVLPGLLWLGRQRGHALSYPAAGGAMRRSEVGSAG
jgi:hypothetical protein